MTNPRKRRSALFPGLSPSLASLLTLASLLALGLSACGKPTTTASSASEAVPTPIQAMESTPEPVVEISSYKPFSCPANPGTAPSGELVAERIAAANTTRTEPGLYEGPVWIDGALYFSDFTFSDGFPSRIQRLTDESVMEVVIDNSGTNGLAVDADGLLLAATHSTKSVNRIDLRNGEHQIITGLFAENAFNSPNDLTEAKDGSIYFTDPDFQRRAAPGGQDKTRVYRISPTGEVSVVDDTIANPNGVSLSPDQSVLYVAGGGQEGFLRAYPIVDGQPGEGRDIAPVSVPDGMAVDCLGNIYVTEHSLKRVRVLTPEGKQIAMISVDANITNGAFGGPDNKTLYLTGAGAVWKIELDVAGFPY